MRTALLAALVLAGCGGAPPPVAGPGADGEAQWPEGVTAVRAFAASTDLVGIDCAEAYMYVTELRVSEERGRFRVYGCGREQTYECLRTDPVECHPDTRTRWPRRSRRFPE